jgi:hypothetical protein
MGDPDNASLGLAGHPARRTSGTVPLPPLGHLEKFKVPARGKDAPPFSVA